MPVRLFLRYAVVTSALVDPTLVHMGSVLLTARPNPLACLPVAGTTDPTVAGNTCLRALVAHDDLGCTNVSYP